jgi:hypothetical protein
MPDSHTTALFSLTWDSQTWQLGLSFSFWLASVLVAILATLGIWRWVAGDFTFRSFELDEAEIGVGDSKLRFRPNLTDRQVAYAIWVELSTRKIGLHIDFEHDVISEIYNSWYEFFSVTRELLKTVPVARVRRDSTQAIIKLSIEVLNEGLRPHLTKWQARFRHWYERELRHYDEAKDKKVVLDPQQIQEKFPQFDVLKTDMEHVNQVLIRYRTKMRELISTG